MKKEVIEMESLLQKLNDIGIAKYAEKSCALLLQQDKTYANDCKDLKELEAKYEALDLSLSQRRLVNDYIACLETTRAREREISHMAGIRDALSILSSLGLLKTEP